MRLSIHSLIHSSYILRAAVLILESYVHTHIAFFSADVKRRRSLYDEDSLDGDRPYENEGINVFNKGTCVQTISFALSLDSSPLISMTANWRHRRLLLTLLTFAFVLTVAVYVHFAHFANCNSNQ